MIKTKKGTELFLLTLKGKEYLPVQQRVLWFREEHPDWTIETFLESTPNGALCKAVIKDEKGRTIATSHKYEDPKGFQDFREKCETGSIGRALALCGFGTQFATELEEGDRIVDSPTEPRYQSAKAPTNAFVRDIPKGSEEAERIAKLKSQLEKMKGIPDPR